MFEVIIYATNNYPHYKKEVVRFAKFDDAEEWMDAKVDFLDSQMKAGSLQDYQAEIIELCYKHKAALTQSCANGYTGKHKIKRRLYAERGNHGKSCKGCILCCR